MSDPILSLAGVHANIAQYHILQGVDLQVPEGGVTMLLGRNGVWQNDHVAHDHGPVAGSSGIDHLWRHRYHGHCRHQPSPARASVSCPRTWASFPT